MTVGEDLRTRVDGINADDGRGVCGDHGTNGEVCLENSKDYTTEKTARWRFSGAVWT